MPRPLNRVYRPKPPNLTGLVEALAAVGLLTAAAGYFFGALYPFELLAHFRLQSIVTAFLTGVVLLFVRRRIFGLICLASALLLAVTISPYFYPPARLAPAGQLKLLSYNVNTANQNFAEVLKYVGDQQADVVFLMEVSHEWVDQLKPLQEAYPHRMIEPREDNFGLAVFSKHPFAQEETFRFGVFDIPAASFQIVVGGTTFHLVGAHPLPPINGQNFRERNSELLRLGRQLAKAAPAPAIFMGDFNLTPFSPVYRELLAVSGLRDSSLGLGLRPTWISHNPLFAIPIDHILISENLAVAERKIGPSLGSDHNPLILSVALRQ